VKVGVHHGSVLSPLLFCIVLEALPTVPKEDLPWELLHANDLASLAESEEQSLEKIRRCKAVVRYKS
jgi:hypothetical protein